MKLSDKIRLAAEVLEFLESKNISEDDMQLVLMSATGTLISSSNVMQQVQARARQIFSTLGSVPDMGSGKKNKSN